MRDSSSNVVTIPETVASFLEKWAGPTEAARMAARRTSSTAELRRFYAAMVPEFAGLVAQIGDRSTEDLADIEASLLNLLLSVVEVSQMVEVFGDEGMGPDVFDEVRFESLM